MSAGQEAVAMIAKARRASRRNKQPLDLRLSVRLRFGDEPDELVTLMQDRRVPLAGSVFDARDAILRGFSRLLIKGAALQPRLAAEVLPLLELLPLPPRRRRPTQTR
jgi:hypothetical protein